MNIRPLGDRVVVKMVETEETTKRRYCFTRFGKGKNPGG